MRDWRKTHKINAEQRKKDNCRSYAYVYLKRGKFVRKPCERCGSENSQMHHPDYSKPLLVVWLCREHHLALHHVHRGTMIALSPREVTIVPAETGKGNITICLDVYMPCHGCGENVYYGKVDPKNIQRVPVRMDKEQLHKCGEEIKRNATLRWLLGIEKEMPKWDEPNVYV